MASPGGPPTAEAITAQTTAFLRKFVSENGKVNYADIQWEPSQLEKLLHGIAVFDVSKAALTDQYAFYLNAYNILVIAEIVQNYPLLSVQDMPGFFDKTQFEVAGEQLTLDQIETDKLRNFQDDPRLQFALVRGTNSFARLNRAAYAGKELGVQLNNQASLALMDPAYMNVEVVGREVDLPKIFKWYDASADANGQTSILYVNQVRKEDGVSAGGAVKDYPYSSRLNDLRPQEK